MILQFFGCLITTIDDVNIVAYDGLTRFVLSKKKQANFLMYEISSKDNENK